MTFNNTYDEFKKIIADAMNSRKVADYKDAPLRSEFLILRHDVEFSLEKAYTMAKIESSLGAQASFFVQLENNSYNPLSDENQWFLHEISSMGHHIGLHYRQKGIHCENEAKAIKVQAVILGNMIGRRIDRFSCHKPYGNYNQIEVDGMINAYGASFFDRTDHPETAKIKYISDSNLQWNYGYPDRETFKKHKRIQLLIHPYGWGEEKRSPKEIIKELHDRRTAEDEIVFVSDCPAYIEDR